MTLRISIGTVALLGHLLLVASTCLPDAIPAAQRKNVTDALGNSYPIAVLRPSWNSGRANTDLLKILIQEVLGYNVHQYSEEVSSSANALYALMGCQDFMAFNEEDRGCEQREIRYHMFVDSWISLFAHVMDDLAATYKGEVPRSGGSMGYSGVDGMYVPGTAKSIAQASTGLALEFYKSWNASWYRPGQFFDNFSAVTASAADKLKPCSQTKFVENSTVYIYYMLTGDVDGVVVDGSRYTARCYDDYWWLAPACRSAPHECVPLVTGPGSWSLEATMQKAAAFHMPLAQAVAVSEDAWATIPKQFTTLFYWWEPDETFLSLDPSLVVFPKFSRQARLRFDYTTSSEEIDVVKLVSHDLGLLAPYVAEFLQKSRVEISDVRALVSAFGPNVTSYDVACSWIRNNGDIWASWIPDRTVCVAGFGLFDDMRQEYVNVREDAQYVSCRPCPVGTFSEQFVDTMGMTFRCSACPAGFRQPSAAASFCLPCAPGTFKAERSREECTPCSFGTFQDQTGAQECQPCANGTTTLGLGSWSSMSCGCMRGTIEIDRAGLNVSCVPCETGLECPSLATLGGLQSGLSPTGEAPQILPGFMSPDAADLSIFRCGQASHCPGGAPARCTGGRVAAEVCATCPHGWRWAELDSACVPCEAWLIVVWAVAAIGILLALPFAGYRRPEPAVSVVRDLQFTIQELTFIALQSLQVFAIIRQISVDWPSSQTDFILSLMLMNVADLGISCIVGSQQAEYVLQASFLPICCAWSCLCIFIASRACRTPSQAGGALVRSVNTVGLISFVFFEMACNMALAPFTCYLHPNGMHSVRQYPSVFCDGAGHASMMLIGGMLMTLVAGFLAACAWAVWRMPYWTLKQAKRHYVAAFRFVKEGYRLDSWWYGVPVLLTGPLLSLPGLVAADDPASQMALTTLILFAHLLLLLLCWPWKVPVVNVIETVAVSGALFSAISAGFFLPPGSGTSFSRAFAILTRTVVAGAFFLVSVMFVCGLIECKCYGRTRRFFWMDLTRPSDVRYLYDGLFSIMESLAEMEEDHLNSKLFRMQPFDQTLLKSCITMLSLEIVPHDSFRNSMQMRATARIRSSYRSSYSLDGMAERALSDDEDSSRREGTSLEDVEAADADTSDKAAEPPASESREKVRVCHVSFSPSVTSTWDDEASNSQPEVFAEAL